MRDNLSPYNGFQRIYILTKFVLITFSGKIYRPYNIWRRDAL